MPIPLSADQIVDDLEERIELGEYPPGSRMPTHQALANLYGVGLTTITKVMRILRERGRVVGVQGLGVYVAEE